MAKSRRKSNGCRRGAFKRKPMGKGWLMARKKRGQRPIAPPKDEESAQKTESALD
ncbi:MAG: hypothetical protein KDB80_14450 [Planctomycetes bacterium]|nr:hypothetical protein [Planctomycetota bacterium]